MRDRLGQPFKTGIRSHRKPYGVSYTGGDEVNQVIHTDAGFGAYRDSGIGKTQAGDPDTEAVHVPLGDRKKQPGPESRRMVHAIRVAQQMFKPCEYRHGSIEIQEFLFP